MLSRFFRPLSSFKSCRSDRKKRWARRPARSVILALSLEALETRIVPAGHLAVTLTGIVDGPSSIRM